MLRSISLHARHHTCPDIHHSIEHIFVCLTRVSSRPGTQRPSHSVRCARLKVLRCTLQCPAANVALSVLCCTLLCTPAAHALQSTRYPLDHTILSYPCCPMLPTPCTLMTTLPWVPARFPPDHAFPSWPCWPCCPLSSTLPLGAAAHAVPVDRWGPCDGQWAGAVGSIDASITRYILQL